MHGLMNGFDPLEWLHQWDDFEMMMYAQAEDDGPPGIFMQVSRKVMRHGAEEWEILYDRRIADVSGDFDVPVGSEMWEERVLRHHLNTHPNLVGDEKAYVQSFLDQQARGED